MEKKINLFLDDLVALCAKHKMAVIWHDEHGIAITSAPVGLYGPAVVEIWNIGPSGVNGSADLVYGTPPYLLELDPYISPEHYVERADL